MFYSGFQDNGALYRSTRSSGAPETAWNYIFSVVEVRAQTGYSTVLSSCSGTVVLAQQSSTLYILMWNQALVDTSTFISLLVAPEQWKYWEKYPSPNNHAQRSPTTNEFRSFGCHCFTQALKQPILLNFRKGTASSPNGVLYWLVTWLTPQRL